MDYMHEELLINTVTNRYRKMLVLQLRCLSFLQESNANVTFFSLYIFTAIKFSASTASADVEPSCAVLKTGTRNEIGIVQHLLDIGI